MGIDTASSLLQLIEKSKLLEPEELNEARETAEGVSDARGLAQKLIAENLLTRWQAGQLLAGRATFHLGKYKLVDLIGRGGMGSVFLARHIMMNRPVALKIISKQVGQNQANLDRFFSEARAVAALNHPNIVHAYSIDNEGDRYYMVMEFVEGQDLQRMTENSGPLDFADAADYIRQAADGLAHAHEKGIVHCDIKPANLLVNSQGVVKILDMGMARLVTPDGKNGQTDEGVLGTVDYMAPELAVHSPDVDLRADIYSLGCTLYFLLSGKPPFPEGSLSEKIVRHQADDPKPIEKLRPGVPPELAEICRKMMAKKPAERFQTCSEISERLSEWEPPQRADTLTAGNDAGGSIHSRKKRKKGNADPAPEAASKKGAKEGPPSKKAPGSILREKLAVLGKLSTLDKRQKLIAGGVTGLLLLAVIGVVGMGLMGSGDELAEQEAAETSAEKAAEVTKVKKDTAPAPKAVDIAFSSDEDLLGAIGADLMASTNQPAAPAAKQAEAAAKTEAKPAGAKAEEKPSEAKPAKAKPAEKMPEAAKPPEKPAEKKPPENKPNEEKPAEKKPPAPPKKVDPLSSLAAAVELPLIGEHDNAKEPFEFGKIQGAPAVPWQLSLLGGEEAMRRNRKYLLALAETDSAKASWAVKLETSVTGSDPQVDQIAKLWREGQTLMFQWADGVAAGEANYLRNCLLQVQVEGNSKDVSLLNPLAVEPIPLDIDRGSAKAGLPIQWLPEGDALKVEITGAEGPKSYQVEPQGPFPLKTPVHLTVLRKDMDEKDALGAKFRVLFASRSSGVTVDVKLVEPPISLFRTMTASIRQIGADVARNQIMSEQGKTHKDMEKARGSRDPFVAKLRQLDAQLWYVNFIHDMQAGGKLYFRIFVEVDGKQVVLASTPDPPPAPKPASAASY